MNSDFEGTLRVIVALWREHGVDIRRPAKLEEIASVETRLGVPLPPEAVALYRNVDGMAASEADFPISTRLIRIWPLAELRLATSSEAARFSGGIVFADYLVHSHEYCLTSDGAVAIVAGDASHIVSPSLAVFLRGYAADDVRVFR